MRFFQNKADLLTLTKTAVFAFLALCALQGCAAHNEDGNVVTDSAKDVGQAAGDSAKSATINNVKEETKRGVNELFNKFKR
ncbi:MAG: hypothetical protein LBO72_09905 [Helicobacteraceae bacterium]|nr:hypothetical protein [Helicobacteraceae bacterium]